MKVRTPFSKRVRVQFKTKGPSRTHQSFRDECDVNVIMAKFHKTGILPDLIKKDPLYGDFSNPLDYQESMNLINHANAQFDSLSAQTRDRFQNNPAKFLEFATDARNADEMVKLGLATKRAVATPPEPEKPLSPPKKGKTPPLPEGE